MDRRTLEHLLKEHSDLKSRQRRFEYQIPRVKTKKQRNIAVARLAQLDQIVMALAEKCGINDALNGRR